MNPTQNSGYPSGAAVFFDTIAQHILAQHRPMRDDQSQDESKNNLLHHVTILLPNYHAAQPLAQSLVRQSAQSSLLLPRMVTLPDWAQSMPVITQVTPDTCRATTLYEALRAQHWFPNAHLWGITKELLTLLDEMTQHHVTLPKNADDFLVQLEQAYQAKRGTAMQFEARVVHELWYAMNNTGELDSVRAYQQRLAQLALVVQAPIYVLQACDFSFTEENFLNTCRARIPVTLFDIRAMLTQQTHGTILCAALRSTVGEGEKHLTTLSPCGTLREQAQFVREHHSTLASRLRLFGAHDLEHEARAAELQVRRWLLAGKKSIAIVAQDRLVARRVRALLERAEILVRDETGWTLSTLSVSTVLMRWLDALQSDFYFHDLLDFLKSPFIFSDRGVDERKQVLYKLEQLLRKNSVVAHLPAFMEMAAGEDAVQALLGRLHQAAAAMQKNGGRKKTDTLAGWLDALQNSFKILGMGLATDEAGAQLLQSLQTWQRELAGNPTHFSLREWRHWLAQQLDANTFRDTRITSPVLLTHLAATGWRSFDAVLLLGCDDTHLPGKERGGMWFNDGVRVSLGLPTRQINLTRQRDALLALLAMNDCVLATWQASKNGEINLLSPYLEMLRTLHQMAYNDDLAERELGEMLDAAQVRSAPFPLPVLSFMPTPAVPRDVLPHKISVGGYNSLVACPYQFYARHILRLNEMDEVSEAVEKSDFGKWVHDILHQFHQQFPVLAQHKVEKLNRALHHISDVVFAPAVQRDYLTRAWLLRWQQAIEPYLNVQIKMELEGWHFKSGEWPFELRLTDDLILHGRIDRVDGSNQVMRVLDYKMIDVGRLRNKLKDPGEDVQLACYAAAGASHSAAYISLDKDKVQIIEPPHDLGDLVQANMDRLITVFEQMQSGVVLPANGIDQVCQYCEMRGLCRKSEWSIDNDPVGEHG
mgnify:CR=1 FL=1